MNLLIIERGSQTRSAAACSVDFGAITSNVSLGETKVNNERQYYSGEAAPPHTPRERKRTEAAKEI